LFNLFLLLILFLLFNDDFSFNFDFNIDGNGLLLNILIVYVLIWYKYDMNFLVFLVKIFNFIIFLSLFRLDYIIFIYALWNNNIRSENIV
jgi:hypothetical protein